MRKIAVVTGCLGFIGFNFSKLLYERGWSIYGIDKGTRVANPDAEEWFLRTSAFRQSVFFHKQDIVDLKHIPDCDVVFNFAAESHVGNSIHSNTDFVKSNVLGVQNLIDLILQKPENVMARPVLVHISTDEVYGDIQAGQFGEHSPLRPSNPYAASKAAAEHLITAAHRTHGLRYQIFRPTNNYGPGQYPEKLIPLSVKLLDRGRRICLHDGGQPVRSWLHVLDCCEAILCGYDEAAKNTIYNIGGEEHKNIDVVREIVKCYDSNLKFEDCVDLNYSRPGQDVRYSISDKKLRMDTCWEPTRSLFEEIDEIIKEYKLTFRW